MSSLAEHWQDTFSNWPTQFKRKGVVIPISGEAIPFSDFLLSDTMLILERPTPDTVGARRVGLPFERIDMLKYTEPLKTEQYLEAGFVKGREAQDKPKRIAPVQAPPPIVGSGVQAAAPQFAPAQTSQQVQQQVQPGVAPAPPVPPQPAAVAPAQAAQTASGMVQTPPPPAG